MGSKLRRLRVQAAAAGERYQAELRASSRKVERARRAAERLGSQAAASSKFPGSEKRARAEAEMRRLLDEMAQHAAVRREEQQAACIDPTVHKEIARSATVFDLPLPDPLHWADYLSEASGKASGLGRVCRVCGKAPPAASSFTVERSLGAPDRVIVDSSDVSAAAAIAQVCEPRPPEKRVASRMPLLAQVALLSMLLAGGEPPKGGR